MLSSSAGPWSQPDALADNVVWHFQSPHDEPHGRGWSARFPWPIDPDKVAKDAGLLVSAHGSDGLAQWARGVSRQFPGPMLDAAAAVLRLFASGRRRKPRLAAASVALLNFAT
jgi:hypothetical protein